MINRKLLVIIMIISITISFIIHMPIEAQETLFGKSIITPVYSDIVDSYYRKVFLDQKVCDLALRNTSLKGTIWINSDVTRRLCLGEEVIPIIYRDYSLALPPFSGFLWFISSSFSLVISNYNSMYSPYTNPSLRSLSITVYYLVMSIFILLSAVLLIISISGILNYINIKEPKLLYILPLLPSFIIYGIYGMEVIAGSFIVLSLYMFFNKRYLLSGIFAGLSIATHLFSSVIVIILLYELLQTKTDLEHIYRYLLGFTIIFASYLVIIIINPMILPKIFIGSNDLACENCLFLYLAGSPTSPFARSISIVSIVILTLLIMILYAKSHDFNNGIYRKIVIGLLGLITFHYIFKPQYLLLISFIIIVLFSLKEFIYYLFIDVINSLIILLWFKDRELRIKLSFLGIREQYNPLSPDSPIQIIAFIRNILLLLLFINLFIRYLSLREYRR